MPRDGYDQQHDQELDEKRTIMVRTGVQQLFEDEIAAGRRARAKELQEEGDIRGLRESNRQLVVGLDTAMQQMRNHGLALFRPVRRLHPFPRNELLKFIKVSPEDSFPEKFRAIIENPVSGERKWAVPRVLVDDAVSAPSWHQSADMCSGSWHGASICVYGIGLRSTLCWDRLHRIVDDIDLSTTASGLQYTCMEWAPVMYFRARPFKGSSNYWILKEVSREFFQHNTVECNIFQYLFGDMCLSLGLNQAADYGSERHQAEVWEYCKTILVAEANEGGDLKRSRWFSLMHKGKHHAKMYLPWLMVLIYHGWRKKWWKHWSQCPLIHYEQNRPEHDDFNAEADDGDGADGMQEPDGDGAAAADIEEEAAEPGGAAAAIDEEAPMSRKKAREAVSFARAASACTFHYVAQTLSKPFGRRKFLIYCNTVLAVKYQFQERATGDIDRSNEK